MSEKKTVEIPVIKPTMIQVSSDPRLDATITFETIRDADVLRVADDGPGRFGSNAGESESGAG